MIKQTLMFSNPVSLTLKDQQMVITFKDNKDMVTRPIEDIGFVIIENPMVSITIPLLNALADNNVSVVFCDKKQMPKTMLMTLEGNTTQQESYKYQIEASAPIKKNVWKKASRRAGSRVSLHLQIRLAAHWFLEYLMMTLLPAYRMRKATQTSSVKKSRNESHRCLIL